VRLNALATGVKPRFAGPDNALRGAQPAATSASEASVANQAIPLLNSSPFAGIYLAISIFFGLFAGEVHPGLSHVSHAYTS